jgi:hypothetical protein
MQVYDQLSAPLTGVVLRGLLLDPERFASRVVVERAVAMVDGAEVDLLQVGVRWPADAEAERRRFESLFGRKLVLATAFVGDCALFAVGADWSERLQTMLGVARGVPAASLGDEPAFVEALAFRQRARVSLSYLDMAGMARFAVGLVQQASVLDDARRRLVAQLLAEVGRGAIISTTNASSSAAGARYELTTHLPTSAMSGAPRLNGALWRIALSPLVDPPMMPPMPVPPPHVTPSALPVSAPPPPL